MMKKLFLCVAMLFTCLLGQAQTEFTTYSSCDTNTNGEVNVEDVTNTTNKVLKKTATETNVVTAEQLNSAFNTILEKLSALETRMSELEAKNNKITDNLGITVNGHEYVDLGLSVKWATCNVGATNPEDYGLYFAWGETTGYTSDTSDGRSFDWENLKYCYEFSAIGPFTKYVASSTYGTVDNLTTLESSDDAAYVNWGGSWRMPTDAELTELRENCTWTWTTENGVNGYMVTSKKAGYTDKSIFLPAAGYRSCTDLSDPGSTGYYFSSSLNTGGTFSVFNLYFDTSGVNRGDFWRCDGQSVRPVCQ